MNESSAAKAGDQPGKENAVFEELEGLEFMLYKDKLSLSLALLSASHKLRPIQHRSTWGILQFVQN